MRVTLLIDKNLAKYVPILEIYPHTLQTGSDGDMYIAQVKYLGSVPEGKPVYVWPDGYKTKGKRKRPDPFDEVRIEVTQPWKDYKIIDIIWDDFDEYLPKGKLISLDTETESLVDRTLLGVSVSYEDNQAVYYYGPHEVVKALTRKLARENEDIWHNAAFDLLNVDLEECNHDTIIEAWLLNRVSGHLSLEELTKEVVKERHLTFEDMGYGGKGFSGSRIPGRDMGRKSCGDADHTRKLHLLHYPDIERWGLRSAYHLEMQLPRILADMTDRGIRVDHTERQRQADILQTNLCEIDTVLQGMDLTFNRRSDEKLADYLYNVLNLPVVKAVKGSGNPSVDKFALAELSPMNNVIPLLILEREWNKALEFLSKPDDYIHAQFNQTRVVTGRLSSSGPNMQQVPQERRRIYIPREGYVFVAADYSQVEMRIAAYLSEEPTLVRAFANDEDVHIATALAVFGKSDKASRSIAKTVNFGKLYGAGVDKLEDVTGSRKSAEEVMERYDRSMPVLIAWSKGVVDEMHQYGYVRSTPPTSRIRFLPNPYGRYADPHELEREAVNTIIQATSADITKSAMIDLNPMGKLCDAHLLLQIHDELVYEVPIEYAEEWLNIMQDVMINTTYKPEGLSLKVDGKIGRNWYELK